MANEKKTLFSILLTKDDAEKFNDIAADREKTKSGVLRDWINQAYIRLENRNAGSKTKND